jgi:4-hydroxybenzoate polyprenyltransferase
MITSLNRRDTLLFKISFVIGMMFLFLVIFSDPFWLRVVAWVALILACLYPITHTPTFLQHWYIPTVIVIDFIIIGLIALNPNQMWRMKLAVAIVLISVAYHIILTIDQIHILRKQIERETATRIAQEAANLPPPAP